jgi:hypothetical protein
VLAVIGKGMHMKPRGNLSIETKIESLSDLNRRYLKSYLRYGLRETANVIGVTNDSARTHLQKIRDIFGFESIQQLKSLSCWIEENGMDCEFARALREMQNNRCAISGRELTEENARLVAIDSLEPIAPSNLQWVTCEVEMNLKSMNVNEFVAFCSDVAELARTEAVA